MTRRIRQATGLRVTHRTDSGEAELVELHVLAREAGLRPAVVSRFDALGLIEPIAGAPDRPLFARDAAALLASAVRLRRDLGTRARHSHASCSRGSSTSSSGWRR